MAPTSRAILLICAVTFIGMVTYFGVGIWVALGSEPNSAQSYIQWFFVSLLLAAPLWGPAILSSRHPRALKTCRWVSAVLLLLPAWLFLKDAFDITERMMSDLEAVPSFIFPPLIINLCCFICFCVILLSGVLSRPQST